MRISIAKPFTERLVEYVRTLRLGPGSDPATDIGPPIGERYRRKVEEHVDGVPAHAAPRPPAAGAHRSSHAASSTSQRC
ncbi:MAG: aldehyde dehydrogenase family protein [Kouleothrix sp.]